MRLFAVPVQAALIVALPALLLLGAVASRAVAETSSASDGLRTVCISTVCFEAEVAVTVAERSSGLMGRKELAENRGMLFVFPEEGRHRFWMKNTLIELDIVFIDADRRIVSITRRAEPCREDPCPRYLPARKAAYALEIAGGLAERHGFEPGDRVEFR